MPSETLHILLNGLIDYAGLFPPAELPMPEALRNYAAYRDGEYAWALGRFIVPAARVGEVDPGWPVSVLHKQPRPIEVAGEVTYVEIPPGDDPTPVAAMGARAKIRMGGASVPSCPEVANFLRAKVPFKATAGLHHPIRNPPAHGFVNLFLAAALAWRGEDPLPTLEEQSSAAFRFADDAVAWHDHQLPAVELRAVREHFAISFGSCSFEEPIADLKAIGWL
jgi:hypothetical protein